MSEFSDSYHLRAGDQQAGIDLLKRAGTTGGVFPPARGWVTVIPNADGPEISNFNDGLLLNYVNAEDHCWGFDLFKGPVRISEYSCLWDGVEESVEGDEGYRREGEFAIRDGEVHLEILAESLGVSDRIEELRALIAPADLDELIDDPMAERFAKLVGLEHYQFMSWRYLESDRERGSEVVAPGVVFVD